MEPPLRLPFRIRFVYPQRLTFPELEQLSDDEVMESLKAGNNDALAILFDRYHRLVLKVATKILRDPVEAQDLMQNVFVEILRAVGQFDPAKGTVRVWIMQYAHHRSISRRQQLEKRDYYRQNGMECLEQMSGGSAGWGILSAEESRRLVHEALAILNQKQRRAVEMACLEGFTIHEIAEVMDETPTNARHYYYRGLEKMRAFLSEGRMADVVVSAPQETFDVDA
jgi:RNA polymerase sigma-70 factor (ECF subfamily)